MILSGLQRQLIRNAARFGALAILLALAPTARAQQSSPARSEHDRTAAELETLLQQQGLSAEKIRELDAGIAALKQDETAITAALIQSAKTAQKLGEDISRIEDRLAGQRKQEDGLRQSLFARRGVLAQVLGALERIGLNPPPAILVKPEDALSSVRSAILLGALVPEMRAQTESLIADLDALKRVTVSIANERAALMTVLNQQTEERHRLDALADEKRKLRASSEADRTAEETRLAALAARAGTLKDLIASLEKDMAAEQSAAERQRREDEKRLALERQRADQSADQAMLSPSLSLDTQKKSLTLPVSGKITRGFGAGDGFGGKSAGIYVAASPAAIVASPVDATVLYAGPFRSYHQLLILDAGDGYHVVLGGMEKSMVSAGQFVLSGEPVGAMATKAPASSTQSALTDRPELYIEFRKDGKPVDSAPWWTGETLGRTGNDT